MTGKDVAIPLAYPDYLIAVDTPKVDIKLPDFGIGIFPNAIHIKGTHNKVPDLGHAGILFFSGKSGTTKYYEYGRYDIAQLGLTRRVPVPDVVIDSTTGRPTANSLLDCLKQLSRTTGQGGRIEAAYVELPSGTFAMMLAYCQKRVGQNTDPSRTPYSLTSHSCITFAKEVLDAAGVATPALVDPRPIGYVEKLQDSFPALSYNKAAGVTIAGITLPSAKLPVHAAAHGHSSGRSSAPARGL